MKTRLVKREEQTRTSRPAGPGPLQLPGAKLNLLSNYFTNFNLIRSSRRSRRCREDEDQILVEEEEKIRY